MFNFAFPAQTALRQAVTDAYRRDEIEAVQDMLQRAQMSDEERQAAPSLPAVWLPKSVPAAPKPAASMH